MTWNKASTTARTISDSWWPILVMALLVTGLVFQRWTYTHPMKRDFAHAGSTIPPVTLATTDKKKVLLNWSADSKPTVVYVFTPTCVWCKRNLEAMRTVANNASNYHFIAVSLVESGVKDYIDINHLTMPVFIAADKTSKGQFAVRGTPTTFVVSSKGVIEDYWPGVYRGKVAQQVEKAFNVKLPEVAAN